MNNEETTKENFLFILNHEASMVHIQLMAGLNLDHTTKKHFIEMQNALKHE